VNAAWLTAALFACAAAAWAASLPASDPDLFWHLASGDWMLDHGRLLDRDVWSYTREGAPYASGQWLGQIALALASRAGGWLGIDLLRAVLVGVGVLFTARATLRAQPHAGWAALPIAAAILVAKTSWGDRPQLFTLALFPVVLDLVLAARLEGRTRRLLLVVPVFLLWANLHGAFAVGLALLAVAAAEAVVTRAPARRPLLVALALAAVASQANPATGGALGWAAAYAATPAGFIVEERAPDVTQGAGLVFAVLLACAFGGLLRASDRAGTLGSRLLWPALLVPFAILGLAIQRQMTLAAVVLAPCAALAVPLALGHARTIAPRIPPRAAAAVLASLVAATLAVAWGSAPREPDLARYPEGAVSVLRVRPGNMLNEYDWGGFLIRFAPETRTFLDGRGALLFVPDVLTAFQRTAQLAPGFDDALQRYDVRLALLKPERPIVEVLRDRGWRELARSGPFVLLERP